MAGVLCLAMLASADGGIAEAFRELSRSSRWEQVEAIPLTFRTYHPQGMTVVDGRIFLTSVEVVNRARGEGVGHLFEVDRDGGLRRGIRLGEGAMYHPGGVDYDGRYVWVSVAEYRPDSRSVVYRVDPETLEAERVFEFGDHLGAIAHDPETGTLIGVSWGSRRYYRWIMDAEALGPVNAEAPERVENGSHYIDYQDAQVLHGTGLALFSGLGHLQRGAERFALGGIELVNLRTFRAVHQVPVPVWTEGGQAMTQNPFFVERGEDGLRVYFIPEDDASTLYIYRVR